MSRKSVAIFLVATVFLGVFLVTGLASARPGDECPPPSSPRVCIDHDNDPDTPPIHVPPGLFRVCNDDNPRNDNKNCDRIAPPDNGEAECGTAEGQTPPDGPVSGILAEISAGVRGGGGAALSDALLDPIACFVASLGL